MAKITADRLRELLIYEPLTGLWCWLVRPSNRCHKGWFPGTINIAGGHGHSQNPYRRFKIDGKNYYAHDLAYLYMTGEWPKDQVDHEDRDSLNNIWVNLRPATNGENQLNKRSTLPVNREPAYEPSMEQAA